MSARPRILLIDDEPSIIKMVSKRLDVEGFDVVVAMDGQEGLDKARSEKPDLIIVDVMMPKLNGYEICSTLKQDAQYRAIPVMLFTAKAQEKDEKLGIDRKSVV